MDTVPQSVDQPNTAGVLSRIRELLVWFFIILGLLLIFISLLPLPPDAQTIVRGFGLSLFPAGLVTVILSRYVFSITETALRANLAATVGTGMESIVSGVKVEMESFSPLFASAALRGVDDILLTRAEALTKFAPFIAQEVGAATDDKPGRVWIVCSSLKGLLDMAADDFDGPRALGGAAKRCDLRILMTDPEIADARANQECRAPGEIPAEVEMNLAFLKRIGVSRKSVRFYPGTPTVFAIATTDRMLLNPYPYQKEAFRCFSMLVHKTLCEDRDIFHQYLTWHFEQPWANAIPVPAERWLKLKAQMAVAAFATRGPGGAAPRADRSGESPAQPVKISAAP
jgi:hypothetical protein